MAKKASAKAAAKKKVKKAPAMKTGKAKAREVAVLETNSIQTTQAEQTIQAEPVQVQEKQETVAAPAQAEPVQQEVVREKKEESKMGEENKGIGKAYNPSEFSQPAVEAGSSGSKVFLYVGISVVVVAVIVAGLFFAGGFGKSGASDLTGATVITAYCSDTDGGYNRFTKGVADGTYYLNYKSGQFMDECAAGEENKLTEYYCKNDIVVYATEPCPDGMVCQDGICV